MNTDEAYNNKIFRDSKSLISPIIYKFMIILIKSIFLRTKNANHNKQQKIENQLRSFLDKINKYIINRNQNNESKLITIEYSKENFMNIFSFLKSQNRIYAGEILEGILIYIFSFTFKENKSNTFGKFLYSNLHFLKDNKNNKDLISMIDTSKILPNEFNDLEDLFSLDGLLEEKFLSEKQENSVFYYLTYKIIFYEKYKYLKESYLFNKSMKYINRGIFTHANLSEEIYQKLRDNSESALENDISCNSIMALIDNLFFESKDFGYMSRRYLPLIKSFFIQVFIYFQNKNSPLMNYIYKNEDYEKIPFCYDLRGAVIEGRFSYVILSPLRIEPRIEIIKLMQNNLRECGLYEIGKVLLFNKNIKIIEINTSLIRNNYIEFLNMILGIYDNYSVEEINLSFNFLKDVSEDYLAKLITHFKGLKTLNLISNEYKRGLSSFFVVLKKLYQKGQSRLENLLLNRILLDEASFYELGELLSCKYCKLKTLYLNFIPMPYCINFLKKVKKNKSLTKLYLDKTDLYNDSINDIIKIINNTNIISLYLYKNKFINFDILLKILYTTKLIKCDNENIENVQSYILKNVDLSNNEFLMKNSTQIDILDKILRETTAVCIDISRVILNNNPDKWKGSKENEFSKSVEKISNYLIQNKQEYDKAIKKILDCEVNIKRNKHLENDIILTKLQNEIKEIIQNERAIYPIFLRDEARKIIYNRKHEEITEKIFNDDEINVKELNNIENKIINYMILNRSKEKLDEYKEIKKSRKLILI